MAVRNTAAATFTAWRTSAPPEHLRAHASVTDEDEARRIEIELAIEPGLTMRHQVDAFLPQCVRGLF